MERILVKTLRQKEHDGAVHAHEVAQESGHSKNDDENGIHYTVRVIKVCMHRQREGEKEERERDRRKEERREREKTYLQSQR